MQPIRTAQAAPGPPRRVAPGVAVVTTSALPPRRSGPVVRNRLTGRPSGLRKLSWAGSRRPRRTRDRTRGAVMIEAVRTSITGLDASQSQLDSASNNLANLNTTSFKANRVLFQDLI